MGQGPRGTEARWAHQREVQQEQQQLCGRSRQDILAAGEVGILHSPRPTTRAARTKLRRCIIFALVREDVCKRLLSEDCVEESRSGRN